MNPFEERVVDERKDLQGKHERLTAFIDGHIYKMLQKDEQVRLLRQHFVMQLYINILTERIQNFKD
jgi:hypothetical protein